MPYHISPSAQMLVTYHLKSNKHRVLFKFYYLEDDIVRPITNIIADDFKIDTTKQGYIAVDHYVSSIQDVAKTILETFAEKLGYKNIKNVNWVNYPIFL